MLLANITGLRSLKERFQHLSIKDHVSLRILLICILNRFIQMNKCSSYLRFLKTFKPNECLILPKYYSTFSEITMIIFFFV